MTIHPRTKALSEVAQIFNGKTPSKADQRDAGYPVLKIRDVDENGIFRGPFESFVDKNYANKYSTKIIRAGDTLILNAAHNADYVGSKSFYACKSSEGSLATGEWLIVRPDIKQIDSRFAHYWLLNNKTRQQIREFVKGIHLYPKDVSRLEVPLLTLDEQRRIAAILDKTDTLRRKRKRAIELLKNLIQSLFLEMFGDPTINPFGFKAARLEDIVAASVDCPHTTPNWTSTGKIALRTSNLTEGDWNWTDTRFVSDAEYHARSARAYVKPGDIVLSREGTVGIAAIVQENMEVCLGQRLVQIRMQDALVCGEYLLSHLLYELAPKRIGRIMVGATSTHLNLKDLRKMLVPIPPKALQEDFESKIKAIRRLSSSAKAMDDGFESLFSSLQSRAFSGQL